jgi:hypothetical protein
MSSRDLVLCRKDLILCDEDGNVKVGFVCVGGENGGSICEAKIG